ncbi:MAG: hypothetical protein ACXWE0_04080, partial [Nitrososphaeraceae archaeon]
MYIIAGIQNPYISNLIIINRLVTNLQVSEQHKLSRTDSELLMKFINSVSIRNQNTAKAYHSRLLFFARFAKEKYGLIFDEIIQKLKDREYDPYDILNNYCLFLKNNYNSSSTAFKDKIITVKTFLEYNDIELSPKKF